MAKGNKKTSTHQADAATTSMQNRVYDASKNAAGSYQTLNADPATMAAMAQYGKTANFGMGGMAALSGDPAAVAKLMNPYMSNVVDASNANYGRTSSMLQKQLDDRATQAGAFGGGRADVATGAAQGELAAGHNTDVANLLYGGYGQAMGQAGELANFGMGANGAMMQGGDYMRNIAMAQANPELMKQQLLTSGLAGGNVGNYTNTDYTKTSAMQNIAGLAATGLGAYMSGGGSLFGMGGGSPPGNPAGSPGGAGPLRSPFIQFDPSMVNRTGFRGY